MKETKSDSAASKTPYDSSIPFKRMNNRPDVGSRHKRSDESFFISQKDFSESKPPKAIPKPHMPKLRSKNSKYSKQKSHPSIQKPTPISSAVAISILSDMTNLPTYDNVPKYNMPYKSLVESKSSNFNQKSENNDQKADLENIGVKKRTHTHRRFVNKNK